MKLYRLMSADGDGKPAVGSEPMMLGERPTDPGRPNKARDVAAVLGTDPVGPGAGLSCYADPVAIKLRRGRSLLLWAVEADDLPAGLTARPAGPPHWHLEPTAVMTLDVFQQLLAATRDLWRQETGDAT